MSTLTQLLGNRELAYNDNLEKGRIWVYSEGNMYTSFCNGFCWKPPGCGYAIIEAWGAAGSGAQMCCCGVGLPGNAPAYVKKCICVCPTNYVCGYIGRSCNNSSALCFRGCSEATCVCWYGVSPCPLYEGGSYPGRQESWKGNNPWGWGNQNGFPADVSSNFAPTQPQGPCGWVGGNCIGPGGVTQTYDNSRCYACGTTNGCICAQGGKGGISYCIDDKSVYSCWITNNFCGSKIGAQHNMCDTARSACGMICNYQPYDAGSTSFLACGYGGDVNCCGGWSCVNFNQCLPNCFCGFQYHVPTAAGVFAEEGLTMSYTTESDGSGLSQWSGQALMNQINAVANASRAPGYLANFTCWNNNHGCGCYEMQGCTQYMPYGVPGSPPSPCGGVRDHAGRGGMGAVRIKYIPTDGGNTY